MPVVMRERLNVTVHFEDAGDGWTMATIPEVGAIGQGRTRDQARDNVIDAMQLVLTPDEQLRGERPANDDELLELVVKQ
jgi:predicted RNase H-like HicB family nuclease